LTSWRFEAIELFKEKKFEGSLIIPEFISKTESDKGKKWVPLWEANGLKRADCILFWIPRTKELIGLTTNWELGYWMGKNIDKVVYGRPDDAYRIGYLDTMWERIAPDSNLKVYNTLSSTIDASILNAGIEKDLYGQEFYDLMQQYRHSPKANQKQVTESFEAVKEYLRTH
jgi:nucleoside 2-deoxyribosyltransferase